MKDLTKDKDRLLIVNEDMRKYLPKNLNLLDHADVDLDGSFLGIKQRNVIETLEMKLRQQRKKIDMLKQENEMLRGELRVVCSADQQLKENFAESKIILTLS